MQVSGGSDISCRSIHVCVYRKEQTRATDRAAVASVWRSLPGVMVPCGCLCIVLSSYCQLFTRDSIPSGNENLASLARPYFPFLPSPFRSRMRVHGIRSGSRDYIPTSFYIFGKCFSYLFACIFCCTTVPYRRLSSKLSTNTFLRARKNTAGLRG